jgi:hypothetical protein
MASFRCSLVRHKDATGRRCHSYAPLHRPAGGPCEGAGRPRASGAIEWLLPGRSGPGGHGRSSRRHRYDRIKEPLLLRAGVAVAQNLSIW